jgi:sortase B
MIEWLDYNDYATRLLPINPDMVGYISIEGTEVSYPVVQRKTAEGNENPNDYYLNRTFKQEYSKSGCIFMDYRNHFDEVVDHRRVVENSGNVFIYGHNMNNRTMFGSLRDYINNPYFYSAHPIVDYSSLYKDYKFKIFAIFIVDGEDYTSEYAFDCWNTLDFDSEEEFYDYVNKAKMRTLVNTNVDVKYGDQLLSLYTCNGLVANAKLILMCREVRAGEDLLAGTENATLNDNVLYPSAYYKYGRADNYDPKKFVPYGPNS